MTKTLHAIVASAIAIILTLLFGWGMVLALAAVNA